MTTQEMIDKLTDQIVYATETKTDITIIPNQLAVDIVYRLKELKVIEKVVERIDEK